MPRAALVGEPRRGGVLWRCEPSTGQIGRLEDRIKQLAEEVRPTRALPREEIKRVALGIDVTYDTASCTLKLPTGNLVYFRNSLQKSIPEVSYVDFRCTASEEALPPGEDPHKEMERSREEQRVFAEEWEAMGSPEPDRAERPLHLPHTHRRPADPRANEYMVSLDLWVARSVTAKVVSEGTGLPPRSFLLVDEPPDPEGVWWRCFVEKAETATLSEQLRFLASQVHPRREFKFKGDVQWVVLNVGVLSMTFERSETGRLRFPLWALRRLLAKRLLVRYLELNFYPGKNGEDEA